jgi:phosphoglycerate-specific signal transduction histidine kinase
MSQEIDEIEDKQFETLLLDKRHKELLSSLREISLNLSKNNDSELLEIISNQGSKLELLSQALSNFKFPDTEVNLKTDQFETFFDNIKNEIINSNKKVIDVIENRLLPHSFELERGYGGMTTSVKVNYKSAKEIR